MKVTVHTKNYNKNKPPVNYRPYGNTNKFINNLTNNNVIMDITLYSFTEGNTPALGLGVFSQKKTYKSYIQDYITTVITSHSQRDM